MTEDPAAPAVHTRDFLSESGEVWSAYKAEAYKDAFLDFLGHCKIPSKNKGLMTLGGNLYPAQERGLDAIFNGLQKGIHDFKWLKGRQQGISTICRPFTLFWTALHPGSRTGFVLDTAVNMAIARTEMESIITNLPARLKFPLFKSNRYGGRFANSSTVSFMQAGVKETSSSGGLGRSQGLNVLTGSEMCMWASQEGVTSLRKSLSDSWENRLFIWESTGRNVGSVWWRMWERAKANDLEEATIFTGWYLISGREVKRGTPMWARYGEPPVTKDEARKIAEVKERYDWEISREQLAWIRKETNPAGYGDEDGDHNDDPFDTEDDYGTREDPWTEEEAFSTDGSNFFSSDHLTRVNSTTVSDDFKPWTFFCGTEFTHMGIEPARSRRDTHFKVWEDPKPDGVYVVSADPAYGANENNDRSAAQVMRCYADKVEQVEEFAATKFQPHQFAWVLASLMGWYKNTRLMLEINGPGVAVWQEYTSLKRIVTTGYLRQEAEEQGLKNYFANCKNYLYARPDAVIPGGSSVHWKTTSVNKVPMMERLRDFLTNGGLILRSREAVEEMRAVTRDGDSIRAEGDDHDDRVLAVAMGILCWEQHERKPLISMGRTREFEIAKGRMSVQDQFTMLSKHQLNQFFKGKESDRRTAAAQQRRDAWRLR